MEYRRKERIDISTYLGKPFLSPAFGAGNDNAEHAAVKIGYPAKTEDAILPDCFQGVAENLPFPRYCRIRRIEDKGGFGSQQSLRYTRSGIAFEKLIGDARPNNPVHPSFQYRRRLTPPVRMDNDYPVGGGDFPAMFRNCRRQPGVFGDFFANKQGIEALLIKIMEKDRMSIAFQLFNRGSGNGMIETAGIGMC